MTENELPPLTQIQNEDYMLIYPWFWAKEHGLGLNPCSAELMVFARVYSYSRNNNGIYIETQSACADYLGVTRKAVNNAVAGLEKKGLITRVSSSPKGSKNSILGLVVNQATIEKLRFGHVLTLSGVSPKVTGVSTSVTGVSPKVTGVSTSVTGVSPKVTGVSISVTPPVSPKVTPHTEGVTQSYTPIYNINKELVSYNNQLSNSSIDRQVEADSKASLAAEATEKLNSLTVSERQDFEHFLDEAHYPFTLNSNAERFLRALTGWIDRKSEGASPAEIIAAYRFYLKDFQDQGTDPRYLADIDKFVSKRGRFNDFLSRSRKHEALKQAQEKRRVNSTSTPENILSDPSSISMNNTRALNALSDQFSDFAELRSDLSSAYARWAQALAMKAANIAELEVAKDQAHNACENWIAAYKQNLPQVSA